MEIYSLPLGYDDKILTGLKQLRQSRTFRRLGSQEMSSFNVKVVLEEHTLFEASHSKENTDMIQ